MMNRKILMIFALFVVGFTTTSAQYTPQKTYDHESIYLKSAFGGLKYVQDGVDYPFGFFGNKLKQELEVSPNAVLQFKKYRNNTLISTALLLGGTALLVAAANSNNNQEILLGTGFGTVFASGLLIRDANNRLNKSIWWYNRDILSK